MAIIDIPRLRVGQKVQGRLILRRVERKESPKAGTYFAVELGNATGTIGAKVWDRLRDPAGDPERGKIVQVVGTVTEFNGRRELDLNAPLSRLPDQKDATDDFLPRIRQPVQELWDKVDAWRAEMRGPLRRAVDLFFADEAFRAEFARTPGATRGHHAVVGGLLLHSCEVAEIARASAKTMGGNVTLVTAGALLHDIGKTQAYSVDLAGFDYTRAGMLLQHIVLGSLMLEERLATLPKHEQLSEEQRLELHHFIQSHHGIPEYGAAVRPMTLEAEILHFADNTSAKANDFNDAIEDAELFPSAELEFSAKRSWRLERRVWKRSHRWD